MAFRNITAFLLILVGVTLFSNSSYADMSEIYTDDMQYLPSDVTYDPSIPLPQTVMGYPVGEWHVRHDQLVRYMEVLAAKSDRIKLLDIGKTHQHRRLLHLHISSPENLQNIDNIQQTQLANWQPTESKEKRDLSQFPLIFWMGYSIHGDEASAANAALLVAYYLAAAQGPEVDKLLDESVIILDPVMNPDGLDRFANWVNMHRSKNLVADRNNREHQQDWPTGRTNHYWFDLNRDWLLLTHPESQARIAEYQKWRPHVLTDFHEMGTDSTYFFQPGIPSRTNPHTPHRNVELTNILATYHAQKMDSLKRLYFTKEAFDDFYYGKGSTYPDAHGSVGILFEQASARGHFQESINGPLSFSQAIQNQFNLSLTTFAGGLENKTSILEYQESFSRETRQAWLEDDVAGFMVTPGGDQSRIAAFLDFMRRHKIKVQDLEKETEIDDESFRPGESYFVSLRQPQYRLIKSLFSKRKRFKDNTFYDVSNWNIALAFNFEFAEVAKNRLRRISASDKEVSLLSYSSPNADAEVVAWAFNWKDSDSPALLQYALDKGASVRQSDTAFTAKTLKGEFAFLPGAVILPMGLLQPDDLSSELVEKARQFNIKLHGITSGLTPQGVDLGSRRLKPVESPQILLLGGKQISQYEAGEVWHYLDNFVGVAPTIVELNRLPNINIARYTHIIAVDGRYGSLSDKTLKRISDWIESGGVFIAQKRATKWIAEQDWLNAKFKEKDTINSAFNVTGLQYDDRMALAGKKRIAGAVFNTDVDLSHPLLFGFEHQTLPVFRNSNVIMRKPIKPFVTAITYQQVPLLAGYTSDEMEGLVSGSAMAVAHKKGQGKVIAFTDNLSFRGYWLGTRRLLTNAIYLSQFIHAEG